MATWQEGNGGGFLAGIGRQNGNAPQASDINTTLGLIRDNNDIQRSGANNVGLQALSGLAGFADTVKQVDMQKATQAFNQAHADAWATGNTDGLRAFAQQNPAFVEQAQKAVAGLNEEQRGELGNLAMQANTALAQGPEAYSKFVSANSDRLKRVGADPNWMLQTGISNPEQLSHLTTTMAMGALGPEKMFDVLDKQTGRQLEQGRLDESVRSNKANESLTARGQDMSAATTRRGQDMAYRRATAKGSSDGGNGRTVQLADGRTVSIIGKLHGAGTNAFYEGIDNDGNTVRVPANTIAAPPTSSSSANNYAMKKDIDAISNADSASLDFMTGYTGGTGSPAFAADVRSRIGGKEQRQLYNAAQRIQGRMQNQGVGAARDMGASGINTVAEAKMYFQSMPQIDYSSPEALQQSIRDIKEYTDNYNRQYQVNVGGSGRQSTTQQPSAQQSAGGSFTSKSGIQFTVK
ncbi:DNA transfer protein [Salmonella enterica]|nr:DNA transfer protein [Salmonella enterica]